MLIVTFFLHVVWRNIKEILILDINYKCFVLETTNLIVVTEQLTLQLKILKSYPDSNSND
jgi:hypothetical protein